MTYLAAAIARRTEAEAAAAKQDWAEAARCYVWAKEQFMNAKMPDSAAEMTTRAADAIRRRDGKA